jgi:hypothetical protein
MIYTDELSVNNLFEPFTRKFWAPSGGEGGVSGEGCAKAEHAVTGTQEALKKVLIPARRSRA